MQSNAPDPTRRPVQFGIGTLLTATVALAVLLGVLRWMDVSPVGMAIVLGVLVLSALGAVTLVVALLRGVDDDRNDT